MADNADGTNTGLPQNPQAAAEDVQAKNAAVAQQLADQGRELYDPEHMDHSSAALDDLAREAAKKEEGADGSQGAEGGDEGNGEGAADGGAGGQEGAGDDTGGAEGGKEGSTDDGVVVEKKDDTDGSGTGDGTDDTGSGADGAADGTPADGADSGDGNQDGGSLDDVQLPDTATPKSAESFQKVKDIAREQIRAAEEKLVDLERERNEWKEKAEQGLPAEAKRELEELREFRTKLDIEVDPQFKSYDQKIASSAEFVYAQLEKAGLNKGVIDKIKEFGGPHKVDMDKILESVGDRQVERLVNAKVADIEQADFDKQHAIAKAKEDVGEYLKQRQEQIQQGATQHRQITQQILDKNILPKFGFLSEPKPLKADASEGDKQLFEAQKQFLATAKDHVDKMLADDSPEMRAIMAGGVVKSLHLHTVVEGQKAVIKSKDEIIATLTKERDEAVKLTDRLKSGSVSQRSRSNASSGKSTPTTPVYDPNQTTEHALDDLAKQVGQQHQQGVA